MLKSIKGKGALLLAGCCILVLFYYLFDPSAYGWMPQCIFHKITGLQCIGCGSQRMIHHLLHADLVAAFHANPFVLCALPFIALLGWVELNRKKHPRLYARMHSLTLIVVSAILLTAWMIVRNIFSL